MFYLFNKSLKLALLDPEGKKVTFKTGKEARRYVTENVHPVYGEWNVLPLPIEKDWKTRELEKFKNGEYFLPEFLHPYAVVNHFLHVSLENSNLLCYVKDENKGSRGIYTRISLKGYLEIYFPNLETKNVESLVSRYTEFQNPLKFATTPEEIERVYTNYKDNFGSVANSCMRYTRQMFCLPTHPTCAYGAGDLAIAYLADPPTGKTIDRAVVWPEKKIYGRVYGSSNLHDILKKKGYTKSSYYGRSYPSFAGAKLLSIPHPLSPGYYILPFIDDPLSIEKKEDYLVLIESPLRVSSTSGSYRVRGEDEICGHCKKLRGIFSRYVWVSEEVRNPWCQECIKYKAQYCKSARRFYPRDLPHVVVIGGKGQIFVWPECYFKTHGYIKNDRRYSKRKR